MWLNANIDDESSSSSHQSLSGNKNLPRCKYKDYGDDCLSNEDSEVLDQSDEEDVLEGSNQRE